MSRQEIIALFVVITVLVGIAAAVWLLTGKPLPQVKAPGPVVDAWEVIAEATRIAREAASAD